MNLDGPYGFLYFWHDICDGKRFFFASVKVVEILQLFQLHFVEKNDVQTLDKLRNAQMYPVILQTFPISFVARSHSLRCTIYQDVSSAHTVRLTKASKRPSNL